MIARIFALLAQPPPWVYLHLPSVIFVFCLGACVGSFINVVIYRLPAGMSVISPPSRCPTCGAKLKFFTENLPILDWFIVRGKCRYCGVRVSPQYMIIELMMALIFVGLYLMFYVAPAYDPWWREVGGPWFSVNHFFRTWPVYLAFAFMLAGLVAMTMIDARTFTIPIQIPLFITITAFIAYPLQAILPHTNPLAMSWPIPGVSWVGFGVAVGGMLGVLISYLLLRAGRLRYSFADYHEYVKDNEALAPDYPHARREMIVELIYLGPCIVGMVLGWLVAKQYAGGLVEGPPVFVQGVGATFAGYLMGGGLIWAIRILGTLGFGREAMGMGDVHLLAAIGAVMGWFDPILIFVIAPFSGLLWAGFSWAISSIFGAVRREIPYGPHLAVATVAVLVLRPAIHWLWTIIFPVMPGWPARGLW